MSLATSVRAHPIEAKRPGGEIDCLCNRCKLQLAHVIIAMEGSVVARVQCKTCRSEHRYPKKGARPAARKGAPRKGSAAAKVVTAETYDAVMRGKDIAGAQHYQIAESFEAGDVIDHKSFGVGCVVGVHPDARIQVLFRDGPKVLAHGRVPPVA